MALKQKNLISTYLSMNVILQATLRQQQLDNHFFMYAYLGVFLGGATVPFTIRLRLKFILG
jgi:hypothetical protein